MSKTKVLVTSLAALLIAVVSALALGNSGDRAEAASAVTSSIYLVTASADCPGVSNCDFRDPPITGDPLILRANCNPGDVATGGSLRFEELSSGFATTSAKQSFPVGGSPTSGPTGWETHVVLVSAGFTHIVQAVCVDPTQFRVFVAEGENLSAGALLAVRPPARP